MSAHACTEAQLVEQPAIGFAEQSALPNPHPFPTGEGQPNLRRTRDLPRLSSGRVELGSTRSVNTYVWLPDHDYAITMRKMGDDSRRLITAYWVELEHERRKLRRKYERRLPS
jgi:hypothetical protein